MNEVKSRVFHRAYSPIPGVSIDRTHDDAKQEIEGELSSSGFLLCDAQWVCIAHPQKDAFVLIASVLES